MITRLFLTILLIVLPLTAQAADAPTPLTKLDAATKDIMTGLDKKQTRQFAMIRNSHGIIRAVESVEKNIDAANASCSEKNPEFKKSMNDRVAKWKADVDPILTQARARLAEMIKLQDFAKPAAAKSYLKKVDEAVAYKGRDVKTIPIIEKKECRKLLGTMDDTQEDLKKLLIENLELDKPLVQETEKPK